MRLSDKWIKELQDLMLSYCGCECDCGDCGTKNNPTYVKIYLEELGQGEVMVGEVTYDCSKCDEEFYRDLYIR